jgi:DNA-binding transcriptional ArsR family regulator
MKSFLKVTTVAISKESDYQHGEITGIDRVIHEPSRLTIMAYLYVVDIADFVFLVRQTGMTWGNLSAHISKLESAGYVEVKKEFVGKKPHTVLNLTSKGKISFETYRKNIKKVLDLDDMLKSIK